MKKNLKIILIGFASLLTVMVGLGVTYANEKPKYSFAQYVRFENKPFYYCEGYVRNPLAFGYYQVDNIWCQTERGGQAIPAKILAEKDMQMLWEKVSDNMYAYATEHSQWNKRYFYIDGRWQKALTHVVNAGMK